MVIMIFMKARVKEYLIIEKVADYITDMENQDKKAGMQDLEVTEE